MHVNSVNITFMFPFKYQCKAKILLGSGNSCMMVINIRSKIKIIFFTVMHDAVLNPTITLPVTFVFFIEY
jgi:hypothetical protein